MLNDKQKNKFTKRAKEEALIILKSLGIDRFIEDTGDFIGELDALVSGLVTAKECEGQKIDEELLEIYDLLTDIVLENEEDLDFLNSLFFN
jgi:hypothetical protein